MRKAKQEYDIKKASAREKRYSTLAKQEGKDAEKVLKKERKSGLRESAKDSEWEVKVDEEFAKVRAKKAKELKNKLK